MLRNPEVNNQTYISGSHKWKYYNRPKIPMFQNVKTERGISLSQMLLNNPQNIENIAPNQSNHLHLTQESMDSQNDHEDEPVQKEIGVQTMMRESSTQTMPYTPKEYVLPGTYPEVLKISHFKYGKQLPPTLGMVFGFFNLKTS